MTLLALGYPVLIAIFLAFTRELISKQREREDRLLNRIQAPQVAISQSLSEPDPEPAFVAFDDDDAYHKYKEQL